MPAPTPPFAVTPAQLAILGVLWDAGEATTQEVTAAMRPARRYAITTVGTMLQRLEARGLVAHRRDGRHFRYRAAVTPAQVKRSVVRAFSEIADELFADDPSELVSRLLADRKLDPAEVDRISELVRQAAARKAK